MGFDLVGHLLPGQMVGLSQFYHLAPESVLVLQEIAEFLLHLAGTRDVYAFESLDLVGYLLEELLGFLYFLVVVHMLARSVLAVVMHLDFLDFLEIAPVAVIGIADEVGVVFVHPHPNDFTVLIAHMMD